MQIEGEGEEKALFWCVVPIIAKAYSSRLLCNSYGGMSSMGVRTNNGGRGAGREH